jgi:sensor histidine kinase YesM
MFINVENRYTQKDKKEKILRQDVHLHGIGLNSIRHIVKSYDGQFIFDDKNDMYIATVMIAETQN